MVSGVKSDVEEVRRTAPYQSSMTLPEKFDWRNPNWDKWLRRWERYRVASNLAGESSEYQVNMLIYVLGGEADELLDRIGLTDEEKYVYEVVVGKLADHFKGKTNLVFERSRFFARVQQVEEPVEEFVNDLHALAKNCKFEGLKEELIMHKVIQGIQNVQLSESLQVKSDLTLKEVEMRVRQAENVRNQQEAIRGSRTIRVDAAYKGTQQPDEAKSAGTACQRCGYTHRNAACPAQKYRCRKCSKIGHFAKMCRGKDGKVWGIEADEKEGDDDKEYRLHSIKISSVSTERPDVIVTIEGRRVGFKIDTGADVTIISNSLYSSLFSKTFALEKTNLKLFGAGRHPLQLMGKFKATLSIKRNQSIQEIIYVMRDEQFPLLGRPAIDAFGLINWVRMVEYDKIPQTYQPLFEGIGKMKTDKHRIEIDPKAKPYAIKTPRRIPLHLRDKTRVELEKLEQQGIISKIKTPTDWVAGMVVVPKPNGDVRICVDYSQLNQAVKRERLMIPSVDELLSQLKDAKWFSKIDCRSGYYQLEIHEASKELTTFITPFGRYVFNRLPMGISSAPEIYHREMTSIVGGLEGVITLLDDSLVFGTTKEEHDHRLSKVLERMQENKVTLNKEKCEFGVQEIRFLGHHVSEKGILPDRRKIEAVLKLPRPTNVNEVRRFLGMCNYYTKFFPRLSTESEPLRGLLKKENAWYWDENHEKAFESIKKFVTTPPILSFFDVKKRTRVAADASATGIGAVLEQLDFQNQWKPVQFASRSLTNCEKRYSNIEREALGITWACERFRDFLVGGDHFIILTDHKPLITLFGKKPLDELTPRIQRFRMRLLPFAFRMEHVAGKDFYVPDLLSRTTRETEDQEGADVMERDEIEYYVNTVGAPNVSDVRLHALLQAQKTDEVISRVKEYVINGWPRKVEWMLGAYRKFRNDLWVKEEMLMFKRRVVVPRALQEEILNRIHEGHGGEKRSMTRARECVWWPGITSRITEKVSHCKECLEQREQKSEPLISTPVPARPWCTLGMDCFKYANQWYIVVADYFSRYLDVHWLRRDLTTEATKKYLKSLFAKFGIPEIIRCDNGTNFVSYEMQQFAKDMGFQIISSSPRYPQSNGFAEAMVKIAKRLVAKGDLDLGLLAHRTTPLDHGISPAELLMGRRLRGTLPVDPDLLKPEWPDLSAFREVDSRKKEEQRRQFNYRHGAKDLNALREGEEVWVKDARKYGTIIRKFENSPRRYEVKTNEGAVLVRNRKLLVAVN